MLVSCQDNVSRRSDLPTLTSEEGQLGISKNYEGSGKRLAVARIIAVTTVIVNQNIEVITE